MKAVRAEVANAQENEGGSVDKMIAWLFRRIYNDREVDAGLLMVALGLWIGLFHGALNSHPWWSEVFTILPPSVWALALCASGGLRIIFWLVDRPSLLAVTALASSFIFAFLGFLVALVEWRMTITPVLFLCSYFSIKSHLRVMLSIRRQRSSAG